MKVEDQYEPSSITIINIGGQSKIYLLFKSAIRRQSPWQNLDKTTETSMLQE